MATETNRVLRNKEYETIYVLRPDVDADTTEKVQHRVREVVERERGKLVKLEAWGRRRLAYPVKKQTKGVYMYVKYLGAGGLVSELERNLKLQDSVIKFQTVLLSDEVNLGAVTVNPDDIKIERLELAPDVEETESREKTLGLVEGAFESRRRQEDEFDDMDEEMEEAKGEPEEKADE